MESHKFVLLSFDGDSRPNGPSGCGWTLHVTSANGSGDGTFIEEGARFLGFGISNEQAALCGLADGLEFVQKHIKCYILFIRGFSKTIIDQMNGEARVTDPEIVPYFEQATSALNEVDCEYYRFRRVDERKNWEAHALAKNAIDQW